MLQRGMYLLQEGPQLAAPTTVLVLRSASHDDTPGSPPMRCPSPAPAQAPHPKCPCSTLRLARAARLLTRQKGISRGGWGRKRHRLDARRCLGGQALSTRRGRMPAASTAPTRGGPCAGPGTRLAALHPARGVMPPADPCLPGAATSKNTTLPAPATSHQASKRARGREPRRGLGGHPPHPAQGSCPRERERPACLVAKGRVQGQAGPCRRG